MDYQAVGHSGPWLVSSGHAPLGISLVASPAPKASLTERRVPSRGLLLEFAVIVSAAS